MSNSNTKLGRPLELLLEFSVPLIAGVVAAVVWANASPHGYHSLIHWSPLGPDSHLNLHFVANDIFMVLFFGIAAKEIAEAVLPGGALNPPSRAINPLLATLGGVFGPIGVFLLWLTLTGDSAPKNGWGIPTATDIALAWLVARIVFGRNHPAVSFLLLLAVADDGIGLGIIAIFYPDPVNPVVPAYLLLVAGAMVWAYTLRRVNVTNFWFYLIGPGILSWAGLFMAHLHPALALVAVVPFMPAHVADIGLFQDGPQEQTDTLNQFEHTFKIPVDLGLFVFGLANAGVEFSSFGNTTWAVFVALAAGKTLGIFLFAAVGHAAGFRLPNGMEFRDLLLAGLIAGLGLTVALFVAGVAFTDPILQGSAKMGALLSAGIAPFAILLGKFLGIKKVH